MNGGGLHAIGEWAGTAWRAISDRPLLACFLLALALRLAAAALFADFEPRAQIWEYGHQGLCASQTNGDLCLRDANGDPYPSAYMPPLTSYLWYGLFELFGLGGGARLAYVALNILLGSLAAPLLVLFARRAGLGSLEALLAGAFLAAYPTFVFVSIGYHATNFTVVGVLSFALLLLNAIRTQRLALFFAAGVVAGACALTRTEFAPIAVLIGGYLLWRVRPLRSALASAMLFAAGVGCVMGPWVVRNYVVFERIIPVANSQGYNLWKAFGPYAEGSGNQVEVAGREEIDATTASVPLGDRPGDRYENRIQDVFAAKTEQALQQRSFWNLVQLTAAKATLLVVFDWTDPMTHPIAYWLPWIVVNALAVWGLIVIFRDGRPALDVDSVVVAGVLVLGMAAAYALSGIHARYRMHIEPFEFLVAAIGAGALLRLALARAGFARAA